MHRILIVEDDKALNNGIALALKNESLEFISCFRLSEARKLLEEGNVDLVLLDVNLPDGDGITFLGEIKAAGSTPVIMLTARDMETDIVAGLSSGADDYVTKPFSLAVLRARVEVQLRNTEGGRCIKLDGYQFDFQNQIFEKNGVKLELSKTEQKILYILVQNKGNAVYRERILGYVWDDGALFVDNNTLSVAVKRLRDKLGDTQHIKTVYGIGYCWEAGKV